MRNAQILTAWVFSVGNVGKRMKACGKFGGVCVRNGVTPLKGVTAFSHHGKSHAQGEK